MSDLPEEQLPAAVTNPLRWFPEFWMMGQRRLRSQARLLGLALVVGVVAGVGAIVFFVGMDWVFHETLEAWAGYRPHHPGGEPPLFVAHDEHPLRPWLLAVIPALGGLLSGLLVYTVAPEAEGHGTDAAIAAYHLHHGVIRPRVPIVKIIASAITIGTGGSGGREGPIAQSGAGFGSFVGGLLRLRPADRRVLMAAGMGAGVAAIFRAPLAGALFAAEVLYRSPDFESEVIIPAGLASVTAFCTFAAAFGSQPLFTIPDEIMAALKFGSPIELLPYLALAMWSAVLAMLYTRVFYGTTQAFRSLPIIPHLRPMLGAAVTGLIGVALYYALGHEQRALAVMSSGYGILQDAMVLTGPGEDSMKLALLLLIVAAGKLLTTSLTIGSGGSGGVFGPSMVIGGCGGGALGVVLHRVAPDIVPHPACFVFVGMAGFFSAAAKTPFSTLVFVSEMTGNYNLLLPTLWVCTISFLLADEQSIFSSQVDKRSNSPAHRGDYVRDVLVGMTVGQHLHPRESLPLVAPGDPVAKVLAALDGTRYQLLPVVDRDGNLTGMLPVDELQAAAFSPNALALLVAADLMRTDLVPLRPTDSLDLALEQFVEDDVLALPVVDGGDAKRLLGIVERSDISRAYLRQVHGPAA
ncbi:MAG TPA: chloride channel protein [Pirellulales bacterium]|jgi:CIC family chloride channel protein|nr:chloride channel protein [Pirellulales bacterium]